MRCGLNQCAWLRDLQEQVSNQAIGLMGTTAVPHGKSMAVRLFSSAEIHGSPTPSSWRESSLKSRQLSIALYCSEHPSEITFLSIFRWLMSRSYTEAYQGFEAQTSRGTMISPIGDTLRDLARHRMTLEVKCRKCSRVVLVDSKWLAAKAPPETRMHDIPLACAGCGTTKPYVRAVPPGWK